MLAAFEIALVLLFLTISRRLTAPAAGAAERHHNLSATSTSIFSRARRTKTRSGASLVSAGWQYFIPHGLNDPGGAFASGDGKTYHLRVTGHGTKRRLTGSETGFAAISRPFTSAGENHL